MHEHCSYQMKQKASETYHFKLLVLFLLLIKHNKKFNTLHAFVPLKISSLNNSLRMILR
jgi:hypothetical protein